MCAKIFYLLSIFIHHVNDTACFNLLFNDWKVHVYYFLLSFRKAIVCFYPFFHLFF